MIQSLKKLFAKPFPYLEDLRPRFLMGLIFGFYVSIFLFIFEPFGLSGIEVGKITCIIGYGVIAFLIIFFAHYIASIAMSNEQAENWTLGNSIKMTVLLILLIGFLCWLYTEITHPEISSPRNLFHFLLYALAIGSIPATFFYILLEQILNNKNRDRAEIMTADLHSFKKVGANDDEIHFGPKNKVMDLSLKQLLCIRADGNYVEVFFFKEDKLHKELVRHPISKVFEEVKNNDSLKQCHRSFIVNFDKVEKVSGNARNLNLHLKEVDFPIPVSRSFPSTIIDNIKG